MNTGSIEGNRVPKSAVGEAGAVKSMNGGGVEGRCVVNQEIGVSHRRVFHSEKLHCLPPLRYLWKREGYSANRICEGKVNQTFRMYLQGITLACLVVSGEQRQRVLAEDVIRVFVFAGQSNMVGSDAHANRIDEYPEFQGVGVPQEDVRFSYLLGHDGQKSQGWEALRPLEAFGPEITFARRVRQYSPGPIAIIKSAVGGTTVARDWNPEAPDDGLKLYPKTLQLIRESLQALEQQGQRYQLEAVLWHQGENDMLDRGLVSNYASGLETLMGRLRQDLGLPQLKWYIAEVSEKGIWGMDHRAQLGELFRQQARVLSRDSQAVWVPSSHLAFDVMGSGQPHYHFGTQGQLQLGQAFADAYLKDRQQAPAEPDRSFKGELPVAKNGKINLFVLAGQRSMEGEDAFTEQLKGYPEDESLRKDQDSILFQYSLGGGVRASKNWEPLGLTGFSGNFGPELTFGAELRKRISADEGLAIVKFTDSGAQGPDWLPEGSTESHRNLYPQFLACIRSAKQDLEDRGYQCQLRGVCWHTGENDTWFGPYATKNAALMSTLIRQTRADLGVPELRWLISQQFSEPTWKHVAQVNQDLEELAATDPRVVIVPTSAAPHQSHHLGTAGTLWLGRAMAQAWLASGE